MDEKVIKTLNYYDGIAKGYRELYHEEQIEKIKYILDYIPKSGRVLDLGSGDGVFNSFAIERNLVIVSLDLSFKLLKLNENKFKINASIIDLPIKTESFEFIVSFTVFQDLFEIENAVSEVLRVLKNKGVLIISFLSVSFKVDKLLNLFEKNFVFLNKFETKKDIILVLKKIKS